MPAPSSTFVPPPPGPEPQGRPRRRIVLPLVVTALVMALIAVLWGTGGLEEAPPRPVKPARTVIDQGHFRVTVRDARIATMKAGVGSDRQRYIVVRMRVVDTGKETAALGDTGLAQGVAARTEAGQWVEPDKVEGLVAGSRTTVVQPGLPVEASVMWKAGPADAPATFTVGLRKWEYGPGFTDETYRWRLQDDDELVARVTLPVAGS